MKKAFLSITASLLTLTSFAQWTTNGNNVTIDKNIGIGTTTPSVKLDVNGDAKVNTLYLRNSSVSNGWRTSHIYHPGHSLTIGTPEGDYSHNSFDLRPGGAKEGVLNSYFNMYTATNTGVHEHKVRINTGGLSFFNGGSVGIGTDKPEYKLDVNGDIRANTLYLKTSSVSDGWRTSRIYYPGHSLIIGTLEGEYAQNSIELKPGGSTRGLISSHLSMYTAPTQGVQERKVFIQTAGKTYFNGGYVGIGTDNPQKLLDVKGTIHAQNIEVDLNGWSDFVFDKDYKLPTLQEVEAHIYEHNRLPDIPSEKQVKEEGINIGEMQAKLLQKIEELTLYVIELKKENNEIKHQLNNLQK